MPMNKAHNLFQSLQTFELFQFRLRLIGLLETRVSQKQLIMGLRVRGIFFNDALKTRGGLGIVAPL